MSEQSMVEKVRRAILALDPDGHVVAYGEAGLYARAAIAAMLEPNSRMYDAYVMAVRPDANGNMPKCSRRQKMKLRWQAMIRAALK